MIASSSFLELHGSLDLGQFWPSGTSDADTCHVRVARHAFRWVDARGTARRLFGFDTARIEGRTARSIVLQDHVVVRLRGVDAPELHYRPFAPHALLKQRAGTFSQPFGAGAARALRSFVERTTGRTTLPCVVRTTVGAPEQAFNPYGRLVGDLIVRAKHGAEIDVNR